MDQVHIMESQNPADSSSWLSRLLARSVLYTLLSVVIVVHWVSKLLGSLFLWLAQVTGLQSSTKRRPNRLVMIGTFYNPGWFYAHVGPLIRCEQIDEVIVITDEPVALDMENVSFQCPSPTLNARVGRMAARLLTVLRVGWQYRPIIYMGYHVMPNSPWALLGARLFGGKAMYQMTGGPVQIEGGGYLSENPLLRATGDRSKLQEQLLYAMVRCFDAVIVRGSKAQQFVRDQQLNKRCIVITGAMDITRFSPGDAELKDFDIVYVARLVPVKGLLLFLEVVAQIKASLPSVRVAIVGDGPLYDELIKQSERLGIRDNLHFLGKLSDVIPVLRRARVYVLLSENEGMSIAMLEAMSCGLPVVARDVGDLGDAITGRDSGVLVEKIDRQVIADATLRLLTDEAQWQRQSLAARQTIIELFSVDAITERWEKEIDAISPYYRRQN